MKKKNEVKLVNWSVKQKTKFLPKQNTQILKSSPCVLHFVIPELLISAHQALDKGAKVWNSLSYKINSQCSIHITLNSD